jgi:hypothetical protein
MQCQKWISFETENIVVTLNISPLMQLFEYTFVVCTIITNYRVEWQGN